MRPILILPSVIFFSSCMLGPAAGTPDVKIPASFRSDTAPHGTSFGDKSWRKVFPDSTLRNLIGRALKNNPDLVAATYRIKEARALAGTSRANWFPTLDGNAATANYSSRNLTKGQSSSHRHSESYNLTGLLSWELDLWGGIARDNQAARARLLESEHRRDAVQTSLIAAGATSHIDLQNLDERLAISRRTAESRKGSLELVTARRGGGVSSDLETGQAEALLSQAAILIPATERAISEKENEIRTLLGEYPGHIVRGGSLDHLDASFRISAGLPSSLPARRPDISAADQAFQAATADIGVAEALRFPSLSLTRQGGVISGGLNKLLQGGASSYLEVLDANSRSNRLRAVVQTYRALGGGWK